MKKIYMICPATVDHPISVMLIKTYIMQKPLLFLLVIFISINVHSQEGEMDPWKKRMFISLSGSVGITGGGEQGTSIMLRTGPKFGYFLSDHIAIGLHGQYSGWYSAHQSYSSFAAGPFARYYILDKEKWGIYMEAGFLYGKYMSNSYDDLRKMDIYGGAGLEYKFNDRFSLDLLVSYNKSLITSHSQIVPVLSLNWRF